MTDINNFNSLRDRGAQLLHDRKLHLAKRFVEYCYRYIQIENTHRIRFLSDIYI